MNPRLKAALRYAKRGWYVLPLDGKKPYTAHGYHDATTDRAAIKEWWRQWPDANVGVALKSSKLVVVDIDGPDGEKSIADLDLPATLSAETPHGRHLYYQANGHDVGRHIAVRPQLDILGDGYVVAPPSVLRAPTVRRYVWVVA
jgi:hypothetical protein